MTSRASTPLFFLAPILIGMAVFTVGPIIASFILSFASWDAVTPPVWIGLQNYREIFSSDLFWQVLRNTLYYVALSVPALMILSILLALAVNRRIRGIAIVRAAFFAPVVSSMVAIALVWSWLFQPEIGLINYFLHALFGVRGPAWLQDPAWAMPAMAIVAIWKTVGYNMVILLAGLQGIPDEYHEAARLDGASAWHRLVHVTLPLLAPTIFFVLVITIINAFQLFEQTYVLTKGGPANATLTMSYFIFQNAFQFFRMGYASALAYVLFAMVFVLTMIQMRMQSWNRPPGRLRKSAL